MREAGFYLSQPVIQFSRSPREYTTILSTDKNERTSIIFTFKTRIYCHVNISHLNFKSIFKKTDVKCMIGTSRIKQLLITSAIKTKKKKIKN